MINKKYVFDILLAVLSGYGLDDIQLFYGFDSIHIGSASENHIDIMFHEHGFDVASKGVCAFLQYASIDSITATSNSTGLERLYVTIHQKTGERVQLTVEK